MKEKGFHFLKLEKAPTSEAKKQMIVSVLISINKFIKTVFVILVFSIPLICLAESLVSKEEKIIKPQYKNCKEKDIYKLNSQFQNQLSQVKMEATGSCIDCAIQAATSVDALKDLEQIVHKAEEGHVKATSSSYKAFKKQLQARVKGQIQAKIAQTEKLRACLKGGREYRKWVVKRAPKVDWPLMKAACEKEKEDFHSSFKSRWPYMRINLALSAPEEGKKDTLSSHPASWLDKTPTHKVRSFSNLPHLSKKELAEAQSIYKDTVLKVPLEKKLSSAEFKKRLEQGKPLQSSKRVILTNKDQNNLREAVSDLREKSKENYFRTVGEMPLLAYSKTGDSQNEKDMKQTFSKSLGHLNNLLSKAEDESVDMALLLSFEPLVEGLLSENEGYCLVAEEGRLKAERKKSLEKWGLVALGVVAATPCLMGGPPGAAICLGAGLLVGGISYNVARREMRDALGRALTGKEFETIASLVEKDREAFWELMLLPMAAWGTTAGTIQLGKKFFKKGASLSGKKISSSSGKSDLANAGNKATKESTSHEIGDILSQQKPRLLSDYNSILRSKPVEEQNVIMESIVGMELKGMNKHVISERVKKAISRCTVK